MRLPRHTKNIEKYTTTFHGKIPRGIYTSPSIFVLIASARFLKAIARDVERRARERERENEGDISLFARIFHRRRFPASYTHIHFAATYAADIYKYIRGSRCCALSAYFEKYRCSNTPRGEKMEEPRFRFSKLFALSRVEEEEPVSRHARSEREDMCVGRE